MELLKTTPGIIPTFNGGLGNQYFQLVAAYLSAKYSKSQLFLPAETNTANPHCKDKNKYLNTVFKEIGIHLPVPTSAELYQEVLKPLNYTFHENTVRMPYKPYDPKIVKSGTIMYSYFQYAPPIAEHEKEIRTVLLTPLHKIQQTPVFLHNPKTTAFLHIRRGDYLDNPELTPILSLDYYIQAINILLQKNTGIQSILVFSDDIQWVKTQQLFHSPLFQIVENTDEIQDMFLMSKCEAGAILANSTFSWWGAFLGPYKQRAPIIYPKGWIKGDNIQIFFYDWIAI